MSPQTKEEEEATNIMISLLLTPQWILVFGNLLICLFIDTAVIALPLPIIMEIGGITTAFVLLSLLSGVCLKDPGETSFGMNGKDIVKL